MALPGRIQTRRRTSFLGVLMLLPVLLMCCNEQEEGIVYRSEINQWQYISQEHGLISDYVNTIFEDSKGNFWIGTNRGISVLSGKELTSYGLGDGLLDNNVYAISEDRNGDIWAGTGRGLNVLLDGQWKYYSYFYGAPIYALKELKNEGGVLIGTGGYGTYHFNYADNRFSLFDYTEDCEHCNSINFLFQSKDESVWIATFEGVRKIRGRYITKFDKTDGLAGNIATTVSEDSWGNIWVGTVEGKTISKISGNTVSQVNFNNGLEQNFIFGIQEDNDGKLWVGTVENGLFHYDGAIMKQVTDGPEITTITALLKDSRGNVWVGTAEAGVAIYITNPRR